jgi:hypothetical protein
MRLLAVLAKPLQTAINSIFFSTLLTFIYTAQGPIITFAFTLLKIPISFPAPLFPASWAIISPWATDERAATLFTYSLVYHFMIPRI